ncbi:MAG: hypothetical protein P4L87_16800, partial [Formivibrio sp.]|nr:hypothetical protein [Formivibrio sp.]
HLRRQIRVANLLLIDAAGQRQIAQTAIGYFVQTRGGNTSPQAQGGWDSFAHDLCFRTALNGHVADFVKPLEGEVSELLKSIREQAKTAKIDLRKVVSIMQAERGRQPGESIPIDADLEGIF